MAGNIKESLLRKRKMMTFQRKSSEEEAYWSCLSVDKLSLPMRRN